MYQNQSTVNKLQFLSSNQVDDPKLFSVTLHDFMPEYDRMINVSHINLKILVEAKVDAQPSVDLTELATYEMELAYYEYRYYQTRKHESQNIVHNSLLNTFTSC